MNYIKELNAFYDQLMFNPLSGSASALWHALMHCNNKSGWQHSFSVPAGLLELTSGVKGTTFKRARTELTDKGYIQVTPGSGNQAATYHMISQIKCYVTSDNHVDSEPVTPSATIPVDTPVLHPVANTPDPKSDQHRPIPGLQNGPQSGCHTRP